MAIYSFDPIFAADPNNAANVAANASIIIFDPNDPGKAPVTITDVTGSPLPNPITVNKNGFGPAFQHATLDRVGWFGAGFTGYFTSYEGMKLVATDAAAAAQAAAATAGADAAAVATAAIGTATTASTAAAVSAATAATNASVSAVAAANSAALVGAPADAAIAAAINGAGATKTALSATILDQGNANYSSAKDAHALRLLSNVASADRQKSVADSRANYEDVASLTETWANQTAWTFTAGTAQVSGNKIYSMGSGGSSANYSLPFTGKVRARATLNVVIGGTFNWTGFGFTKATPATVPVGAQIAWIGVRSDGQVVAYDQGNVNAPSPGLQLSTGTYYITAVWDGTRASLTITNTTGAVEWRWMVATTLGTPTGLVVWTGDERTTTGTSVGAITARAAQVTHPTRTVDGQSPSVIYTKDAGGQNIRIALPKNYDSRKPVPLILVAHGNGGDALTPLFGSAAQTTFYTSALADGYAIASSDMHGTYGTWGSPNSVTDLLNLYRYCRDNYAIGPVVLLGESAGGATMFNALAQRVMPEVAALLAWYPVANLEEEYNNHGFTTPIHTAYGVGSLAAIDLNKYSPIYQPGYAFRGVPMRIYASPADITVPTALNAQIVVDKAKDYSPEATIVVTSGGHGHSSNFQWSDAKAFLDKYVAG